VRLHRRLADVDLRRDLLVRQPLPFAAAAALLAAIALSGALIAARTTVRRDIT
jgi:hypothetical protein